MLAGTIENEVEVAPSHVEGDTIGDIRNGLTDVLILVVVSRASFRGLAGGGTIQRHTVVGVHTEILVTHEVPDRIAHLEGGTVLVVQTDRKSVV